MYCIVMYSMYINLGNNYRSTSPRAFNRGFLSPAEAQRVSVYGMVPLTNTVFGSVTGDTIGAYTGEGELWGVLRGT